MSSPISETQQKWIGSLLFLTLVMLGSFLIWGRFGEQTKTEEHWRSSDLSPRPVLGAFGQAPEFSLTERSGNNFSSSDLKDRVWIADFIFTSCAGQCPMMSAHMQRLQTLFPKTSGPQLVSFTVDPARDNPQVLSEYADRFSADKDRWFFLTGRQDKMNRILKEFLLSGVDEPAMHSTRFILVDPSGTIRGYYDSTDAGSMNRLVNDAKSLLQR